MTSKEESLSISEQVKKYIDDRWDEGYDFKDSKKRTQDFENWATKNKINPNSSRAEFYRLLDRKVREKGVPREEYFQQRAKKEKVPDGAQKVKVTYDKKTPSGESKDKKPGEDKAAGESAGTGESKSTSETGPTEEIPWEMCVMPFEALIQIMHSRHPEIKLLNDEEKMMMGKGWQPIFQKLFGKEWFKYLMAAMVTLGVMVPRTTQFFQLNKKEAEEEHKQNKKTEEPQQETKEEKIHVSHETRAQILKDVSNKGFSDEKVQELMNKFA